MKYCAVMRNRRCCEPMGFDSSWTELLLRRSCWTAEQSARSSQHFAAVSLLCCELEEFDSSCEIFDFTRRRDLVTYAVSDTVGKLHEFATARCCFLKKATLAFQRKAKCRIFRLLRKLNTTFLQNGYLRNGHLRNGVLR